MRLPILLCLAALVFAAEAEPVADPDQLADSLHRSLAGTEAPLALVPGKVLEPSDIDVDGSAGFLALMPDVERLLGIQSHAEEAARLARLLRWRLSHQGQLGRLPGLFELSEGVGIPVPKGRTRPISLSAWRLPQASVEALYEAAFIEGHRVPSGGGDRSAGANGEPLVLAETGLWWVEADDGRALAGQLVWRGDLRLLVSAGDASEVAVWVVDAEGRPCPGVRVVGTLRILDQAAWRAQYRRSDDGSWELAPEQRQRRLHEVQNDRWMGTSPLAERRVEAVSDALGVVRLPLDAPDGAAGVAWQLAAGDGRRCGLSWDESEIVAQAEHWQGWAIPARPAWLPGETAQVAVALRASRGGREVAVEGRQVELVIGSRESAIARTAVVDAFGMASAEFPIPRDAEPGPWPIACQTIDRGITVVLGSPQLRVEAFRPPPFDISVVVDEPRRDSGDPVQVRVETRSFDGAPIAAAGTVEIPWNGIVLPFATATDGTAVLRFAQDLVRASAFDRVLPIIVMHDATGRPVRAAVPLPTLERPHPVVAADLPPWLVLGEELVLPVSVAGGSAETCTVSLSQRIGGQWAAQQPLIVPLSGGRGLVRWTPERAGSYEIAGRTLEVRAAGESDQLRLRCDTPEPVPGSRARLVLSGPRSASCVVWIEDAVGRGELRSLTLPDGRGTIELPVDVRHTPAFRVRAAAVRGNGVVAIATLTVPTGGEDRGLSVQVELDGDPVPGGRSQAIVQVRDRAGRPVAAAVALSAIDEIVYRIAPDSAGDGTDRLRPIAADPAQRWQALAACDAPVSVFAEWITAEGPDDWIVSPRVGLDGSRHGGGRRRAVGRGGGSKGSENGAGPDLRTDLRYTAAWAPLLRTGDDGTCRLEIAWPEQLTTWRLTARAVDAGRRSGVGTASAVSSRPLSVDLDLPRLLRRGDQVRIQALVANRTAEDLAVTVTASCTGAELLGDASRRVLVPSGERLALAWELRGGAAAGEAVVAVRAMGSGEDPPRDGLEMRVPCLPATGEAEHAAGGIAGPATLLQLPAWTAADGAVLSLSRGPAGCLDEALEVLARYPYGCTEQTLSRFLPAAMLLGRSGDGGGRAAVLAAQLPDMVGVGLRSLQRLRGDAGWGWWQGQAADQRLTAWVAFGLGELAARGRDVSAAGPVPWPDLDADPQLLAAMLADPPDADAAADARAAWRQRSRLARSEDADGLLLLALAAARSGRAPRALLAAAWMDRARLDAGRRGLLALALQAAGEAGQARQVVEELGAGSAPPAGHGWLGDPVAQAGILCLAGLRCAPDLPLADDAAGWLMGLRRGGWWGSTLATTWACLALGEHAELRPLAAGSMPWRVLADGREIASGMAAGGPVRLVLPPAARAAARVELQGAGLWYGLACRGWADPTPGDGRLALVRRLHAVRTGRFGEEVTRPWTPAALRRGDQIEVELEIASATDLEQVLIEVPLAAGISPLATVSGPSGWWGRIELRADRTAFVIDRLPAGRSTIRYRCLAEMAGRVRWPGPRIQAMYRPDLVGGDRGLELSIGPEPAAAETAADAVEVSHAAVAAAMEAIPAAFATSGDPAERAALLAVGERIDRAAERWHAGSIRMLVRMLPSDTANWPAPAEQAALARWLAVRHCDQGLPLDDIAALCGRLAVPVDGLAERIAVELTRSGPPDLERFEAATRGLPEAVACAVAARVVIPAWPKAPDRAALARLLDGGQPSPIVLAATAAVDGAGWVDAKDIDPAEVAAWLERVAALPAASLRWRLAPMFGAARRLGAQGWPPGPGHPAVDAVLLRIIAGETSPRVRERWLQAAEAAPVAPDLVVAALPAIAGADARLRLLPPATPWSPKSEHRFSDVQAARSWLEREPDAAVRQRIIAKLPPEACADAAWLSSRLAAETSHAVQAQLIAAAPRRPDIDALIAAWAAGEQVGSQALVLALQRGADPALRGRALATAAGDALAIAAGMEEPPVADPAWWASILPRLASIEHCSYQAGRLVDQAPDTAADAVDSLRERVADPWLRARCLERLLTLPPRPGSAGLPADRIDRVALRVHAGAPAEELRRWLADERHHMLVQAAWAVLIAHGTADDARWLVAQAADRTNRASVPSGSGPLLARLPAAERLALAASLPCSCDALVLDMLATLPVDAAVARLLPRRLDPVSVEIGVVDACAVAAPAALWQAASDPIQRLRVLRACGSAGRSALEALASADPDPWIRAAVASAAWPGEAGRRAQLRAIGARDGADALRRELRSRDPDRRRAAAAVLHELEGRRPTYTGADGSLTVFEPW